MSRETEVGGYVLHLYCQREPCVQADPTSRWWQRPRGGEFAGYNLRAARQEARAAGWKIEDGEWTCPGCIVAATRPHPHGETPAP